MKTNLSYIIGSQKVFWDLVFENDSVAHSSVIFFFFFLYEVLALEPQWFSHPAQHIRKGSRMLLLNGEGVNDPGSPVTAQQL